MLRPDQENWAKQAAGYFKQNYGLDANFSLDAARLYVALWGNNLSPRITSAFRDPVRQRSMRAAWDRGDRAGLRARPADPDTSLHCKKSFFGKPAARAIDIVSTDEKRAAAIASAIGIGAGLYFKESDPGHFYSLRA